MSLEQAMHERWQTCAALTALVPADRFRTGWVAPSAATGSEAAGTPVDLPYVVLERVGDAELTCASGGRELTSVLLRLRVWAADLAQAKQIAGEIDARFHRRSFVAAGVAVQDIKRRGRRESPRADGAWQLELDYLVRTETRGA